MNPEQITAGFLDSPEFKTAWTILTSTLKGWEWQYDGLDSTSYLTGNFSCYPFPALFTHSVDLGIPRERFEEGVPFWLALELTNRCFLETTHWMTWWSRTQDRTPNPFSSSYYNEDRHALATALHKAIRPRILELDSFQAGCEQLWALISSSEILAEAKEQIEEAQISNMDCAIHILREQLGFTNAQILQLFNERLHG